MKKLITVLSFVVFCFGCKSVNTPIDNLDIDGKELGRAVAVAWLFGEPAFTPEKKEVVIIVWKAFNTAGELVDSHGKNAPVEVRRLAMAEVDTREEKILVGEAVEFFWSRISKTIDSDYSDTEIHKFLSDFRKGVKSVINQEIE